MSCLANGQRKSCNVFMINNGAEWKAGELENFVSKFAGVAQPGAASLSAETGVCAGCRPRDRKLILNPICRTALLL